ncbi:MAG: VWA domain-containing protein [Gammaproteobacteria bacterium]|nr:VWA domain-containing protein [Gammaproteobacteria bacterium]
MPQPRANNFLAALVAGALAGYAGQSAADDTEIYLGSDALVSQQGQVRPNVLLLLDTSGSMSTTVPGTGLDRLDNMKLALKTILDQSNNINFGLMRFTDTGGPVIFPVANIDEDVAVVEGSNNAPGGSDVFARVAAGSSDDAQQTIPANILDPSPVVTSDPTLPLGLAPTATAPSTVVVRTGDGANVNANTVEEQISNGANITGTWTQFNRSQIDGFRFPNIVVPRGARIISALMFGNSPSDFTSTNPLTIHFQGERNGNVAQFSNGSFPVSPRPRTAAQVNWVNPERFFSDQTYPNGDPALDLRPIVQEIICFGQAAPTSGCPAPPYGNGADGQPWNSGNAMGVIVTATSALNNERSYRTQAGAGGTQYRQTRLEITYDQSLPAGLHAVGLRFNDIAIPRGAKVLSARVEFVAAQTSGADIVPPVFEIRGHLLGNAPTFANSGQKIDGRPKTTASVTWQGADLPAWTKDTAYQTPDLTPIVQEIVDQAGWCGNNSMSLQVKAVAGDTNARIAYSSEGSSSYSPVLIVDIDETQIAAGGGCINQIVTAQIFDNGDDAEQSVSTGGISLTSTTFDLKSTQVNGLRFRDINIPKNATILAADLTFVSKNIDTSAASIVFKGEAADDSLSFNTNNSNISGRATTAASVTWNAPSFESTNQAFTTSDLKTIVQELVNRANWSAGNNMTFIQSATSGTRRAYSRDDSPSLAPRLRIKVQYGGAIIPPLVKTVRERLKEITDTLTANGFTPLVGQLYEAARYYRGEGVVHGKQRSHSASLRPNTRVSHPASYTGGTLVRDAGCTDANLSAAACASERIDGDPLYKSPIDVGCQANYIVMLTDGEANHNANEDGVDHGVSLAQSLVGGTCIASSTGEKCGRDLAGFLATQDQRSDLAGAQNVKVYTIGFNLEGLQVAVDFLTDVANAGGGQFYEATDAAQLAAVFQSIFADILSQPTSFATPSLSVNAFNKLFNRNQVYFSLFEPSTQVAWDGNVKKYNVCDLIEFTGCTLGEILDAGGTAAIGPDFRIRDEARSEWSGSVDGIEIHLGGAAN